MPFSTTDEYFAQPPMDEDYPFAACGQVVLLSDPTLAAAPAGNGVIVHEQATPLRNDNKGA